MIDDLGYYKVGTEIFSDKIPAIFRAQQLNTNIDWIFNDGVFKALDWTSEPTTSLDEFYKIRAKQIREEYDYVIMFCSGGADSTNMLFAFLNNGLHIDEVVASAPVSGLNNWKQPDASNTSVEATIAETFLTQIPLLKRIQQSYPNVKVVLHDYFEDMLAYKPDDWLFKGNDWMHPTMAGRYNLEKYSHLKRIAESGKKIAVVQGIDKPMVVRFKDNFYLMFKDNTYNNKYNSVNHPNCFPVFFYHSPQLPQLVVKQAHETARFIMRPENKHIYNMMLWNDQRKSGDAPMPNIFTFNAATYERGIVPAIYPSIKADMYQADKPDRMFLGRHDAWFYDLHYDTKIYQMMMSDLNNLIASTDKRFLDIDPYKGLLGFKTYKKLYNIGPVENFKPMQDIILDNVRPIGVSQFTNNNDPIYQSRL
jgi:hypothetical protein